MVTTRVTKIFSRVTKIFFPREDKKTITTYPMSNFTTFKQNKPPVQLSVMNGSTGTNPWTGGSGWWQPCGGNNVYNYALVWKRGYIKGDPWPTHKLGSGRVGQGYVADGLGVYKKNIGAPECFKALNNYDLQNSWGAAQWVPNDRKRVTGMNAHRRYMLGTCYAYKRIKLQHMGSCQWQHSTHISPGSVPIRPRWGWWR